MRKYKSPLFYNVQDSTYSAVKKLQFGFADLFELTLNISIFELHLLES